MRGHLAQTSRFDKLIPLKMLDFSTLNFRCVGGEFQSGPLFYGTWSNARFGEFKAKYVYTLQGLRLVSGGSGAEGDGSWRGASHSDFISVGSINPPQQLRFVVKLVLQNCFKSTALDWFTRHSEYCLEVMNTFNVCDFATQWIIEVTIHIVVFYVENAKRYRG